MATAVMRHSMFSATKPHSFEILTPGRVYVMFADNEAEKMAWLERLEVVQSFYEEKRQQHQ